MTRPPHLRIVASGDDWATDLRPRSVRPIRPEHLARIMADRRAIKDEGDYVWNELQRVAKQDRQTRTIRCTIGFLAAGAWGVSLATAAVLYFAAELVLR